MPPDAALHSRLFVIAPPPRQFSRAAHHQREILRAYDERQRLFEVACKEHHGEHFRVSRLE